MQSLYVLHIMACFYDVHLFHLGVSQPEVEQQGENDLRPQHSGIYTVV